MLVAFFVQRLAKVLYEFVFSKSVIISSFSNQRVYFKMPLLLFLRSFIVLEGVIFPRDYPLCGNIITILY